MTAVTFDSATLKNVAPFEGRYIGDSIEVTLTGTGTAWSDITTIQAKVPDDTHVWLLHSGKTKIQYTGGSKGSLVLDGQTHTNCVITAFDWQKLAPGAYRYTITFRQDTS